MQESLCNSIQNNDKALLHDPSRPHFSKNKLAFLSLSEFCNQRCTYCYLPIQRRIKQDLVNVNKLRIILGKLKNQNVKIITLVGGEPSLLENFYSITEEICNFGMELIVQSNGSLNRSQISHLSSLNTRFVSISIDSFDPKINDKVRFKGATELARTCICHCIKNGLCTRISTVVARHNITNISNLVATCNSLGVAVLNLHRLDTLRNEVTHLNINLSPKEWLKAFITWKELSLKSQTYIRAPICFVNKHISSLLYENGVSCPPTLLDTFNINANGDIYRCPLLNVISRPAWNIFYNDAFKTIPKDEEIILSDEGPAGCCPLLWGNGYYKNSNLIPICPIVKTTLNPHGGATNSFWDSIVKKMIQ